MNIVLDANVIKGHHQEVYLGVGTELSDSTAVLFARIRKGEDVVYLDDGGQIKHEWGNLVDSEWFTAWYANNLTLGCFQEIPVEMFPEIKRKLNGLGWPVNKNRDVWYVRTAKQLKKTVNAKDRVYLIAEDLHFFDPRELRSTGRQRRINRMCDGRGSVHQFLRNSHDIHSTCMLSFNAI